MLQHGPHRLKQDLEIERERPVLYIIAVERDDLVEVRDPAAAAHLPHAGDAGLCAHADAVPGVVLRPLVLRGRARADKAHLTLEDIVKLRELVEAGVADKIPDSGGLSVFVLLFAADDSWIVVHLEHHAVLNLVFCHQLGLAFFRVHVHAAELVHLKNLAVLSDALLREEDRAGRLSVDNGRDKDEDDPGQNTSDKTSRDVQQPLEDQRAAGGRVYARGDDIVLTQAVVLGVPVHEHVGIVHGNAHLHHGVKHLTGKDHRLRLEDEDLVHMGVADILDRVLADGHDRDGKIFKHVGIGILVHQNNAHNVEAAHGGWVIELFQGGANLLGGGDEDDGALVRADLAVGEDELFIELAQTEIHDDIEREGDAVLQTGVEVGAVHRKEVNQRDDKHGEAEFEDSADLIKDVAPDHALVIVIESDDQNLNHEQQGALDAIALLRVADIQPA